LNHLERKHVTRHEDNGSGRFLSEKINLGVTFLFGHGHFMHFLGIHDDFSGRSVVPLKQHRHLRRTSMSLEFHTLAMTTLMSQWTNLSSFETLLLGFMWMKCYNVEPVFPLFQCARCCRTQSNTREKRQGVYPSWVKISASYDISGISVCVS
jgi:hypothetical protein